MLPYGRLNNAEAVQRFQAEAAAAAGLQHPNIVTIHEVGEHEGQHYFSMDFIEGRTLAEIVREQPLPAKRAASYVKIIADAVHSAHQHGILHRDLKPSNILIDAADQPRVTDFGLAKRLAGKSEIRNPKSEIELTLSGQVLGSPNFMAPEQAAGRSQAVGPGTDIYALGAILYHLLTRQPPFQADTLTTLLRQVAEADPVSPRLLNPTRGGEQARVTIGRHAQRERYAAPFAGAFVPVSPRASGNLIGEVFLGLSTVCAAASGSTTGSDRTRRLTIGRRWRY